MVNDSKLQLLDIFDDFVWVIDSPTKFFMMSHLQNQEYLEMQ